MPDANRATDLAERVLAYVFITSGDRLPEPGKGCGTTAYVGSTPYQTIVLNMGAKRLVVMVTEKQDLESKRLDLEHPLLSVELRDFDIDELEPNDVERVCHVHAFKDGVWVEAIIDFMNEVTKPQRLH
jgi:hypothetical protein